MESGAGRGEAKPGDGGPYADVVRGAEGDIGGQRWPDLWRGRGLWIEQAGAHVTGTGLQAAAHEPEGEEGDPEWCAKRGLPHSLVVATRDARAVDR